MGGERWFLLYDAINENNHDEVVKVRLEANSEEDATKEAKELYRKIKSDDCDRKKFLRPKKTASWLLSERYTFLGK
jgi:hypothetical protein